MLYRRVGAVDSPVLKDFLARHLEAPPHPLHQDVDSAAEQVMSRISRCLVVKSGCAARTCEQVACAFSRTLLTGQHPGTSF